MVIDSVGDFVRFTLRARVQTSDDSLQLGELANHFRGQIAFGEFGGAIGLRNVRQEHAEVKPLLGEPAGDGAHTLDLVPIAAEARLVGHPLQLWQIVGEPTFLIRLPEELRVGEARSKNAFVAGADQSLRVLVHIDDRQEVWRQFPILLFNCEILLVIAHDRHQNLVRQAQERRVETPLDHRRKFVEISH